MATANVSFLVTKKHFTHFFLGIHRPLFIWGEYNIPRYTLNTGLQYFCWSVANDLYIVVMTYGPCRGHVGYKGPCAYSNGFTTTHKP